MQGEEDMRNWFMAIMLVALATIGLNVTPAQAGGYKDKTADITFTNYSSTGTFEFTITPATKSGKIKVRQAEHFTVKLAPNATFTWNGAERKGYYDVAVKKDGVEIITSASVGPNGGNVAYTGDIPPDSKDWVITTLMAQLAAANSNVLTLQDENNDLKAQLAAANSNVLALQAQITSLQQTIAQFNDTLKISASLIGASQGRVRQAGDDVVNLNFTASATGQLTGLSVMLTGSVAGYYDGGFSVDLVDANTNSAFGVYTTWDETRKAWVAIFPPGFFPEYTIDAGTTKVWKLRVYSADFKNDTSAPDSLTLTVVGATWSAGTVAVPLTVASVSYE